MFLYDHYSIEPINSNMFTIGSFEVKKYAICIMIGAIIAFLLALKWAKKIKINEDVFYTGFALGLIIGVLGARIFYCIFDDFHKTITKPWTIITEFRNGGLAISGVIISVAIFVYFYCKKVKIHPLFIGEFVAPGLLIGQICGRWGNFFNQEAHGGLVPGETLDAQREWLWFVPKFIKDNMFITKRCLDAPVDGYYHPTFLYESTLNIIGLAVILSLRKWWKKYLMGDAVFIYLMWYGCVRFFIESMRTDAQTIGNTNIKIVSILCVCAVVVGSIGMFLRHKFNYMPETWYEHKNINNSFGKVAKKEEIDN